MLEKINDNTYSYKRLTVHYENGKFSAIISLPRFARTNKLIKIEAVSELDFIKQLHRTIENHLEYEAKMSKRG